MREEYAYLTNEIDRRSFLATGAGALAAAAALDDGQTADAQGTTGQTAELPKRALGRTGAKVTMLSLGTWMSPGGGWFRHAAP